MTFRRVFASLMMSVVGALLVIVVSVVLARVLKAEQYGEYSWYLALFTLFVVPIQSGLATLVLRETAKYNRDSSLALLKGIWVWAIRVGSIYVVILIFFSLCVFYFFDLNNEKIIVMAACCTSLIALLQLCGNAIWGLKHPVLTQIPDKGVRPLFLVSSTVFFFCLGFNVTTEDVLLMHIVATVIAIVCGVHLLRRVAPKLADIRHEFLTKSWGISLVNLGALSALALMNKNMDVFMLGWFANFESVGVYRVVGHASMLMLFVSSAIQLVVSPYLSRAYNENDYHEVKRDIRLYVRVNFLISVVVFFVFLFLGDHMLLVLYGEQYELGYQPLVILSFGCLVSSVFGFVVFFMNMIGEEYVAMIITMVSVVINFFLNVLLIPLVGVSGAAIATAISIVFVSVAGWYMIYRKTSIDVSILGV